MGPGFIVCTFFAAVLVLLPLPWLWRTRNYPAIILIAWLSTTNLIYWIDAIVWAHSVKIVGAVYCDICALKSTLTFCLILTAN
jgi:pheromone a factor receptor